MSKNPRPIQQDVEWGFWFSWTLISLLSWFAGAFIGQLISEIMGMLAGLAVTGAIVGLGQWFILQSRVRRAGWWILATAVGVTIAGMIGGLRVFIDLLNPLTDQLPFVALEVTSLEHMLLGGTIPGLIQWLILRRWIYGAGWWILGSATAWATGIIIIGYLTTDLSGNILREGLDGYEAIVAGMSVTSALTGLLMRWQLQFARPEAQMETHDRWGNLSSRIKQNFH